jgi:hypothetical protein
MKLKFAIGYIFLVLGVLLGGRMTLYLISQVLKPPTDHLLGSLGAGFAWVFYILASIFIAVGAILLKKHKSAFKKFLGIVVILLGIIPQVFIFFINPPVGPMNENLIFFLLPFLLYLVSGILLIL